MKTLRLILGDQLNINHSWYQEVNTDVIYCMFEVREETDFIKHHVQKITAFFAAMRNFAQTLKSRGHNIHYVRINQDESQSGFLHNLNALIKDKNIAYFEYQEPDSFMLDKQLRALCDNLSIPSKCWSTEHFFTERDELKTFFKGKKQFLMESFYRYMRKKHNVLMIAGQPEGGLWNYDKSNRKKWKSQHAIPGFIDFKNDITEILEDIKEAELQTIGRLESDHLEYPVSREQALEQLKFFCKHLLVHFGDYQDAMHTDEVYLFHSRISFALNAKLISPMEVIEAVIEHFRENEEKITISQVEGFVRQILGWREYMRGMYWAFMPSYKNLNSLDHSNKLPEFFWTGKTRMNCLSKAINNSLDNAYAHHIQRLMITGNFALLNQTDPDEVDNWYLGIYADALEWVQLPNTRGMSQFADNGLIATKPYISSGSYIDKMSNYCQDCSYNRKERTTDNACPFNSLYWNFLDDHRDKLAKNRRMGMMYSLLDKIPHSELVQIKERALNIMNDPDAY